MNWVQGIVRAILMLGLPVAALAFAMTWWALRRGIFEARDDVETLNKEIQAFGKKKKEEKPRLNPVHDKWFKFGGGFYGLVGLYTYALVEWREVLDLVAGIPDLVLRFQLDVLINFFIESLTNFITAVTWPLYWMEVSSRAQFWHWFVIAYAGYWAGMSLAQRQSQLR